MDDDSKDEREVESENEENECSENKSNNEDENDSEDEGDTTINTASASKVGKFRPFLGEAKKNKRSADEYLSFQIQEFESTTLETTLGSFCERSLSLLDATNAAM